MIEGSAIASSARAVQESMKYAGYFSFSAQVKGDATPEDLEQAWYDQVDRLNNELVPGEELQKVKNQISADAYRRLESNAALLFQLGMYEATGNWEYINDAPPRLLAVTPQDIRRAVATYLTPRNRNVAAYARRAGSGPPADLSAFPPQVQAQVEAMLARLLPKDDPDELRTIIERLDASPVPPAFEPAMDYIAAKLRQRLRELEGN
jgi:predicted Zn-dependent peptidase